MHASVEQHRAGIEALCRQYGVTRWRPLKHFCASRLKYGLNTGADNYLPEGVRLIRTTDIAEDGRISPVTHAVFLADEVVIPEYRLRHGDLLFSRSGSLGKHLLYEEAVGPATFAGYLVRLRPSRTTCPKYVAYCSQTAFFQNAIAAEAVVSTISNFNAERYGSLRIPWWPVKAQRAIADFLDAETARIDALIAKKRGALDRLSEREVVAIEATIMSAAQGTTPLRRLLRQPPQYGAIESGEDGEEDWPRYLRITDLESDGQLRAGEIKRLAPKLAAPYLLGDGDILFARSGATAGKAFRYRLRMGIACFAGYLIRFQFDPERALPEFIELWSRSNHYWDQVRAVAIQATIANVNADRYLTLLVPNVPLPEQATAVRELHGLRARHRRVGERMRHQIALLRERRQALITAAVTGELAISGAAA